MKSFSDSGSGSSKQSFSESNSNGRQFSFSESSNQRYNENSDSRRRRDLWEMYKGSCCSQRNYSFLSKRTLAILAALGATTIYGLNHTIAKGVMPMYITPFGFIMLRVLGATILFWSISFLGPKEKIEWKDWGRVILCSLFGMAINMLAFFKGLDLSTPINSAVLVTTTPIIVVILSFFLIKEKIRAPKSSK